MIRFWTSGPPVPGGFELQEFLNRLPGIRVDVDGKPGTERPDAFKRVTGRFLLEIRATHEQSGSGEPRLGSGRA
jgi:hypothetical protein